MTSNLWSSRIIIALLGLAFVLTGCNPQESLVSLKPDSGDKKYSGNISDQDVNRFLASVKKVDGAIEARYKMARYFQKRNKHKVAIVELKDIIQIAPTFVKAYNALGFSYDSLGDFKAAIRFYELALEINPNLDYVHNNLGFSQLLSNNYDAAISEFQKAIVLNNESKRFRNNLGFAYAKKGQYDLALEQFRLTGSEFEAYYRLGQILYREGKYAKAFEYNEKAYQAKTSAKILSSVAGPAEKESLQTADAVDQKNMRSKSSGLVSNAKQKPLINKKKRRWLRTSDLLLNENKIARPGTKNSKAGPKVNSDSIKADSGLTAQPETKAAWTANSNPEDNKSENHQPGRTLFAATQVAINEMDKDTMETANNVSGQFDNTIVEIEIEISNGNGVDRMAARLGRYLSERGFNVTQLQNAKYLNHEKTKIFYYNGQFEYVQKLLEEIPVKLDMINVIDLKQVGNRIKILIGNDMIPYDGTISKAYSAGHRS